MSPLRDQLKRLDRGRAIAWAEVLEREFPGIGDQPHRLQGFVALKPYRNPEPRPAVAALVDGRAYVIVDGRPDLFPVLSDHGYVFKGRDVRVLTIGSYKWRQYYMILIDGWTTPDTFSAALRGNAGPADGEWWPAEKGTRNTQIPPDERAHRRTGDADDLVAALLEGPDHADVGVTTSPAASEGEGHTGRTGHLSMLVRQGRLHVAIWAVSLLVIGCSAISAPTGSPARQSIEGLLVLASIGLFVTSVTAFFAWLRRRRS